MFQTHYFKKTRKGGNPTMTSVNDSIVFTSIPYGKLVCLEDISRLVVANKENDGIVNNQKETEVVLKGLVENGWVGEVYGIKLEKFLETLK